MRSQTDEHFTASWTLINLFICTSLLNGLEWRRAVHFCACFYRATWSRHIVAFKRNTEARRPLRRDGDVMRRAVRHISPRKRFKKKCPLHRRVEVVASWAVCRHDVYLVVLVAMIQIVRKRSLTRSGPVAPKHRDFFIKHGREVHIDPSAVTSAVCCCVRRPSQHQQADPHRSWTVVDLLWNCGDKCAKGSEAGKSSPGQTGSQCHDCVYRPPPPHTVHAVGVSGR